MPGLVFFLACESGHLPSFCSQPLLWLLEPSPVQSWLKKKKKGEVQCWGRAGIYSGLPFCFSPVMEEARDQTGVPLSPLSSPVPCVASIVTYISHTILPLPVFFCLSDKTGSYRARQSLGLTQTQLGAWPQEVRVMAIISDRHTSNLCQVKESSEDKSPQAQKDSSMLWGEWIYQTARVGYQSSL